MPTGVAMTPAMMALTIEFMRLRACAECSSISESASRSANVASVALHFGTSSWSEKSWVGPFYPAGTKPAEYLTYYATQFDTVEADTTYYRVPDRKLVQGWERKTPKGFTLAAKFPRSIV